jgi:hypothetical protein
MDVGPISENVVGAVGGEIEWFSARVQVHANYELLGGWVIVDARRKGQKRLVSLVAHSLMTIVADGLFGSMR